MEGAALAGARDATVGEALSEAAQDPFLGMREGALEAIRQSLDDFNPEASVARVNAAAFVLQFTGGITSLDDIFQTKSKDLMRNIGETFAPERNTYWVERLGQEVEGLTPSQIHQICAVLLAEFLGASEEESSE